MSFDDPGMKEAFQLVVRASDLLVEENDVERAWFLRGFADAIFGLDRDVCVDSGHAYHREYAYGYMAGFRFPVSR